MAEKKFYIEHDGRKTGPFSETELRDYVETHDVTERMLVFVRDEHGQFHARGSIAKKSEAHKAGTGVKSKSGSEAVDVASDSGTRAARQVTLPQSAEVSAAVEPDTSDKDELPDTEQEPAPIPLARQTRAERDDSEDVAAPITGHTPWWRHAALIAVVASGAFLGALLSTVVAQSSRDLWAAEETAAEADQPGRNKSKKGTPQAAEAKLLRQLTEVLAQAEKRQEQRGEEQSKKVQQTLADQLLEQRKAAQTAYEAALTEQLQELHSKVSKAQQKTLQDLLAMLKKTHEDLQDSTREQTASLQKELAAVRTAQTSQHSQLQALPPQLQAQAKKQQEALEALKQQYVQRLQEMEKQWSRVEQAMQLPTADQLPEILFVLEASTRMSDYQFEKVRGILLAAVLQSIQQTPLRPLGLLAARGKQLVPLLPLEKHHFWDLLELRKNYEQTAPAPGEDTSWQTACNTGIQRLVTTRGKRRRLVYITCNPLTPAALNSAELAQTAVRFQVEVWIVQLLKSNTDQPSRELSYLAARTGGQYAALFASRTQGEPEVIQRSLANLGTLLARALDLRHVPGGLSE